MTHSYFDPSPRDREEEAPPSAVKVFLSCEYLCMWMDIFLSPSLLVSQSAPGTTRHLAEEKREEGEDSHRPRERILEMSAPMVFSAPPPLSRQEDGVSKYVGQPYEFHGKGQPVKVRAAGYPGLFWLVTAAGTK